MTFDPMSVEVRCVTLPKDHCVQVPWQYIDVCGYSDQFCKYHIHTTYYVHTYYVQNEWSHSLLLNSVQARQLLNSVQARQKMSFMYKSMGAKHSNWQLSQNNQYVSYALLSLVGRIAFDAFNYFAPCSCCRCYAWLVHLLTRCGKEKPNSKHQAKGMISFLWIRPITTEVEWLCTSTDFCINNMSPSKNTFYSHELTVPCSGAGYQTSSQPAIIKITQIGPPKKCIALSDWP